MQNNSAHSLSVNFTKEKEEGYKRIFKRSPLISSMSVGWNDLVIAYDQFPPGEIPTISVKQHCLGIYTNMPSFVQTERTINGRLVREQNIQGDCVIVPANTSHQVAWNHEKELGTVVQMSPQYFSQLFKETTGITPHQYVIRCRIERAKDLLKQGLSIAETATQVGFVDQSHLHRHFKRLMGVTPKTFSQQFKKRKN